MEDLTVKYIIPRSMVKDNLSINESINNGVYQWETLISVMHTNLLRSDEKAV